MLLLDKEFDLIDGSDCHKVCFDRKTSQTPSQNTVSDIKPENQVCFDIKTLQTPSQNTVSDVKPENQVFNDGIVLDDGKESDIIYINDVE